MIKAILFDCFGVLVGRGFRETYRLAGGDPAKDDDFIRDSLGQASLGLISHQEFHDRMARKLGTSIEQFGAAVAEAERVNTELLDYIGELHKTYKTAIVSNANIGSLQRRFDASVLRSHFDALVVSGEIGMVKPDPGIYNYASDLLGVENSQCVFVDDQRAYCDAAVAAGMHAICYDNFAQCRADLQTMLR